jgi:hypothetical protein
MEPECLLPCSLELATGPYPDPDASSSHPPTLFLHSNIIFPSMTRSYEWSIPFKFTNQILYEANPLRL